MREFLILSPKRNNDAITDEDRANLLLSSAAIAVSNVGWYDQSRVVLQAFSALFFGSNVPIFIRVQHEWRNMFVGLCEGSGLRTHFNICQLKNAPHQYRHLSGLLEIFKSKLVRGRRQVFHAMIDLLQGSNISNDTIVMVAVRFTYVLKDFESAVSRQVVPRDESGMPLLTDLPFGSLYDPVR